MRQLVQQLEQIMGISFQNSSLLLQAVTHPSFTHESALDVGDYQRLEFLGDSVLGLLLAELLYEQYPTWNEGALSQLRSRLAGQDVLAERARALGLGACIMLGRGEEQTAGRTKESILADVLEALIAAAYLDQGLPVARSFVETVFKQLIAAPENIVVGKDSKSALQELLSAKGYGSPLYQLAEESGPPHDRQFTFELLVDDIVISRGVGRSKKIAQQAAASEALARLHAELRLTV